MQIDPTIKARVDRMDAQKANRIRTVESLPDEAEDGDSVLLSGQLHVMPEGFWRSIDDALRASLMELTERVATLEGNDNG